MSTGVINIMKRAALEAVENSKPCDLRYGSVTSVNPLKVQITSQLILPESLLIVPQYLTDYSVDVTVNWNTDSYTHTHEITDTYSGGGTASEDAHTHNLSGRKSLLVHNALQVGDRVALLRSQSGQSYFILDRI